MTREQAQQLLTKYLHNKNLLKHSLAAEAAMKGLYQKLIPKTEQTPSDEEKWGITGLLHDIDYELAQQTNKLDKHGLLIFELEPDAIPPDIAHAIKAHNFENTGVRPENLMDWSIVAADQLTGLIVAAALVHPDKKLAPLTPETILKRFREKSFAKGANRNSILYCKSRLNIPLEEFVAIVLASMQSINKTLDL